MNRASSASASPRVLLLTGGGDAPGLNAAVRGFFHVARSRSLSVWVSHYGFEGLLGRADVAPLKLEDVRGILPRGGSILGCSTTSNPFGVTITPNEVDAAAKALKARLEDLAMDVLVLAGGDGTANIARILGAHGVRCVGIPKTIDGDLGPTVRTIGNDTAVETVVRAIDALHSTAEAHKRVMVLEVMGRNAGWVALRAGIAGGADAVLIPEIPYDPARVIAKVREREALGLQFSIVVVGEGACPAGGAISEVEPARGGRPARLGGAGQRLLGELVALEVGHDVRVTVLGHLQRGGAPCASDRLLATRLGAYAAELCAEGRFNRMAVVKNDAVESVTFDEACAAPGRIDVHGDLVRCARAVGIELGST
jgi:ATP-dependent phosphofructokinase / diphosphate-dependent phosphofructokinase